MSKAEAKTEQAPQKSELTSPDQLSAEMASLNRSIDRARPNIGKSGVGPGRLSMASRQIRQRAAKLQRHANPVSADYDQMSRSLTRVRKTGLRALRRDQMFLRRAIFFNIVVGVVVRVVGVVVRYGPRTLLALFIAGMIYLVATNFELIVTNLVAIITAFRELLP